MKPNRRTKQRTLYHGGAKGLWRDDLILANMAEHRYVEGCPHCEAQRRGEDILIDKRWLSSLAT